MRQPLTEITKQKISAAHRAKGDDHWCKRPEVRAKISTSQLGRKNPHSPEARNNMSLARMGMKFSPAHRKALSDAKKRHFANGAKPHNWKGGVSRENSKLRATAEYREWRKQVFQRDDYTCQACGQRGYQLEADHELPVAIFPDLRFEVLNGRTLCKSCHAKTPTYKSKVRTFYADLIKS